MHGWQAMRAVVHPQLVHLQLVCLASIVVYAIPVVRLKPALHKGMPVRERMHRVLEDVPPVTTPDRLPTSTHRPFPKRIRCSSSAARTPANGSSRDGPTTT
jgi:hypothetical protein